MIRFQFTRSNVQINTMVFDSNARNDQRTKKNLAASISNTSSEFEIVNCLDRINKTNTAHVLKKQNLKWRKQLPNKRNETIKPRANSET